METVASCHGMNRPLIKAMSDIALIPGEWLRLYREEPAIFRGEFPPHAFFEHDVIDTRLHGLKLKDSLAVVDGVITGDAEKVVAEESESLGVIGGDPLFTSRPIFP